MPNEHHESPPTAPKLPDTVRPHTIQQLDSMLRAYWATLVIESEPLAEAILERALKEAVLQGKLFV